MGGERAGDKGRQLQRAGLVLSGRQCQNGDAGRPAGKPRDRPVGWSVGRSVGRSASNLAVLCRANRETGTLIEKCLVTV